MGSNVRIIKLVLGILVAVWAFVGCPPPVKAQGITYNQVITWAGSKTITSIGPSDTIRDVNQTGAWLYACAANPDESGTVSFELEGSYDKVSWFQISTLGSIPIATSQTNCQSIVASGYFPFTRLNVTVNGIAATVSANYSSSFTPIVNQGAQRLGQQAEKVMPEGSGLSWAYNLLSSTPVQVTSFPATFSSVQVYNPNSTVVYFALSPTNTLPPNDFAGGGYEVAVGPTSTLSVSFPVPLSYVGTDPTYAMCSSSFTALVAPSSACVATVIGVPLPIINTTINAAGTPQTKQYDPTPW